MAVQSRLDSIRLLLAVLGLCALVACAGTQAVPEEQPVQPVHPGEVFPAASFNDLNAPDGRAEVELAQAVGSRPVVLYYWIVGNLRSETVLRELQDLADELGPERVAAYAVAVPRPGASADVIRERIRTLGVRLPVLEDDGFRIGRQLQVQRVPNISVLDRQGRLRMTNGASLAQGLRDGIDVEAAIRAVAETGEMKTYGTLGRYFPVVELEGRRCPDFTAPLLADSVEQRWHNLLDREKLNVLVFWSVDCPHCRKSLPEINDWLRRHPGDVNIFSAANVGNEAMRVKTKEFCEVNDFVFPTLVDRDARIGNLFQVTSTPTIVIIRPDGVIDSAIVTSSTSFAETIEEKRRQHLQTLGS